MSALLLVVSLELGLRGVLMYGPFNAVGPLELARFNRANLCNLDPSQKTPEHSGPVEHSYLCLVQLLPVDDPEPAQCRFANLEFARLPATSPLDLPKAPTGNADARGPPPSALA
ncbi:MAG: hypothetical protein NZN28_11795 [Meiothermus sp.]|uniref:hypothetical protein n=1 Tax=Meiothermus sp. TaxID=1955249 RepID=UPI0025E13219|nr:hypothetical protein [Meiothermus sp.]MCS7069294.1 hypothetical protein [Meiothermus sp.]